MNKENLRKVACILVVIGALNWGSIGLINKDLVKIINSYTFKSENFVKSIYILVGLAATYLIIEKIQSMDISKLQIV